MSNRKIISEIALTLFISSFLMQSGHTQTKRAKYSLSQFDNSGCMAKGRVQDCSSGTVMQQILADGKNAIPILISQLTETAKTKNEIADYWGDTRSGDVAFVVLNDLFTDDDLQTFGMPGVPDWSIVQKRCNSAAQACWDEYLRKHGRMPVKQGWQRAWNLHKNEIYWDAKARCFRVPKN
jgi:hypothetical protein